MCAACAKQAAFSPKMRAFLRILALVLATGADAEELPLQRSSHPRGFTEGGALPPILRSSPLQGGGQTRGMTAPQNQPGISGASSSQRVPDGVNIIGNTRLDARVQSQTSATTGQQNTSSNRVGNIGAK